MYDSFSAHAGFRDRLYLFPTSGNSGGSIQIPIVQSGNFLFFDRFFLFIFVSIRITFDGKKLIWYEFFFPVRRFSVDQIDTAGYDSAQKILLVYCRGKTSLYWFPCRMFAEKDMDGLLEFLAREHGIKTMKT